MEAAKRCVCRLFKVLSGIVVSTGKSQDAHSYRQGRIEDIGEYCLRDVRATAELFRRLEGTLLPLVGG
jgi:hypothetical protein